MSGNIKQIDEYDFGTGAPGVRLRYVQKTYLTDASYNVDNLHILDRLKEEITYDSASNQRAKTINYYDDYTSPRVLNGDAAATQRDATFNTSYVTRGNVTRTSRWLNTTGGYLDSYFEYDISGNVRKENDPGNHVTSTTYTSATQYAYPYQITNPLGHNAYRAYDFNSATSKGFGYLTQDTDINGNTTNYTYDVMGRVKTVTYPDGGLVEKFYSDLPADLQAQHQSAFVFQDRTSALPPRSKVFTKMQASPFLEKTDLTVFDGLGRVSMAGVSRNTNLDWARTEYDGNQRVRRKSNPIALANTVENPAGSNFTEWTTTDYDGLDRVIAVTGPDGLTVTTSYPAAS